MITMGGDGAWACTRHRETAVSAFPVDVVDTVGAGDAFTAGLLSALGRAGLLGVANRAALSAIDEDALTDVLTFAARVAAATCGRRRRGTADARGAGHAARDRHRGGPTRPALTATVHCGHSRQRRQLPDETLWPGVFATHRQFQAQ